MQQEDRKRMRLEKKRKMEDRWEIMRWLTIYIEANQEEWEREKWREMVI